jgi:phage terminase small subunit
VGKRGPKPTPTAKLIIGGSRRGKERVKTEPQPVNLDMPVCPAWLNGEARNVWNKIAPELRSMNCLTYIDGGAFARYCVYMVLWMKELANPGRTEATLERYANQLARLENSFGLTPAARAGLSLGTKEESDPLQELLNRRKSG